MYVLAAVLDCEANFLVLEAYNYTSITSVMLLDCFTIPCAMVLSAIFLNYRSLFNFVYRNPGMSICTYVCAMRYFYGHSRRFQQFL